MNNMDVSMCEKRGYSLLSHSYAVLKADVDPLSSSPYDVDDDADADE
jgi:hypothetical protein